MNKILIYPDPLLRKKSQLINKVGYEEKKLSKNMFEIMKDSIGIGLAAPQIGELKRIITIQIKDLEKKIDKSYALFNPEILWYSEDDVLMEEGCLSVPRQFAEIKRPQKIRVRYLDISNKTVERDVDGVESRVIQHEIDHLEGKLFIDYLSSLKRNIIIKKLKKLKKLGEL